MNEHVTSPKAGRSLEGLIAPLRGQVAIAVSAALTALPSGFDWLKTASSKDLVEEGDWLARSAWAAVAIALIEAASTGQRPNTQRALSWFDTCADGCWDEVDTALSMVGTRADLVQLLPYLLDTFGRTTRLDVMRDGGLRDARSARKQIGSFYTPADVVAFMVDAIASSADSPDYESEFWYDPACGSGVFLAGALGRRVFKCFDDRRDFALTRLYGTDISPQACDFAAFTILSMIADAAVRPRELWLAIRSHFVALDATQVSFGTAGSDLRQVLGLSDAPLRLICNPPYVSAGSSSMLADGYPTRALYLPFVEMAWRVANGPSDATSLVVPLALGANRSADHRRCRTALAQAGGSWTLLFFDRQPHALFGEEAKTRATIAIRRPGSKPAEIRTSRMLKWTSRQRSSIFSEARATSLGQANIGQLVPKLGGDSEVQLYKTLDDFRMRLGIRPELVKATAEDIAGSQLTDEVFVAGTGYNFLNVFRNYPDHLSWRGTLSTSGIHRIRCQSAEAADAVTAIMTSRLTFWLWHVECDGFHVPSWFINELPLLNIQLNSHATAKLAALGREAWAGLQQDILLSSNRDRLTFAFRPTLIGSIRSEIDRTLLSLMGGDLAHAEMLEQFETSVVSIDGSVRRAKPRLPKGEINEAV